MILKSLMLVTLTLVVNEVYAQEDKKQMVRLAKLVIDSAQLESYNAILKEEIETSIKVESGVLTLYAVAEKENLLTSQYWRFMQMLKLIRSTSKRHIF